MNILVTGATGNVGKEVIKFLCEEEKVNIYAGVRNIEKAKITFAGKGISGYRFFDYENSDSFKKALFDIDMVFLLRPPHISEIKKYFVPLFDVFSDLGISKVVFLSVQGAEKSKIIPHNKVESLMNDYKLETINLRPSYFMQNLTTTLINDIHNRELVLPSKNARFNWIDIKDIAQVASTVILNFDEYKGKSIELTGEENLNFYEVVKILNDELIMNMSFRNVNPLKYFFVKKKEGYKKGQIVVMLLLHLLPRFQSEPDINDNVLSITGHRANDLKTFISNNKSLLKNC